MAGRRNESSLIGSLEKAVEAANRKYRKALRDYNKAIATGKPLRVKPLRIGSIPGGCTCHGLGDWHLPGFGGGK